MEREIADKEAESEKTKMEVDKFPSLTPSIPPFTAAFNHHQSKTNVT